MRLVMISNVSAPILAALLSAALAAAVPLPSGAQETQATAAEPSVPFDPGAPEGAIPVARSDRPFDRYALPVGRYDLGGPNVREIEGRVIWAGYRLDAPETTTAEVMEGYRTHLAAHGFAPVLDCSTLECGGFDFRFGVQLLPPPSMLIDAADFAQLSASKSEGGAAGGETFVSILVSRLLGTIYIQTVTVSPGEPGVMITPAPEPAADLRPVVLSQDEQLLLDRLTTDGHVPVHGLVFEPGGAALSEGSAPALETLAKLLTRNPKLAVVIVGHSDNQGPLDANIELSQRRAVAVRDALIARGVDGARLEAHGAGYLTPVTTNATEEGRTLNRRVELVVR